MKVRVVSDAHGRVIQAVPVMDPEGCPFPNWTTKGHTIELREIYAAVYDRYLRAARQQIEKVAVP
jgi:hypothetical protein